MWQNKLAPVADTRLAGGPVSAPLLAGLTAGQRAKTQPHRSLWKGSGSCQLPSLPFESALRVQDLAAGGHRFGGDQHKGDHTWLGAAIDPIVDRAALHQHVAGLRCTVTSSSSMSISPFMTTA